MKHSKQHSIIVPVVYWAWGACSALILALIFFCSGDVYACRKDFANLFLLLFIGLAIVLAVFFVFSCRKTRLSSDKIPVLVGLFFMLFQIWLMKYYSFQTGWDVQGIVMSAWQAARGEVIDVYTFSVYPNNILLTYIFSRVLRLGLKLGLAEYHAYDLLLIGQSFLSFLTGLLTYYVLRVLTKNRNLAFSGYLVYLLLVGLSPWVSIPYSDASGIFFPVAILALFITPTLKPGWGIAKWVAIGFLSWFGYQIKPTVFIVLIALLIIEFFTSCRQRRLLPFGTNVLLLAVGVFLSSVCVSFAVRDFGYEVDPEKTFGPAHFLAMGLNENSMGFWAAEDVNYSESFLTSDERTQADLDLVKQRLEKMGVSGLLRQYKRKLLTNFNDGTFAWAEEGNFFRIIPESSNEKLASFIRSFYYVDGVHYHLFLNFAHALWLAVLFLSAFSCLTEQRTEVSVIMLTLLGFVIYGLLFEARARYTYLFSPFFIILSVLGLHSLDRRKRDV